LTNTILGQDNTKTRNFKDKLNYPDETRIAQDIRKAYILFIASLFDVSNVFRAKSFAYLENVSSKLDNGSTSLNNRVLSIIMQCNLNFESLKPDLIVNETLRP
jgi:hypothetical protein